MERLQAGILRRTQRYRHRRCIRWRLTPPSRTGGAVALGLSTAALSTRRCVAPQARVTTSTACRARPHRIRDDLAELRGHETGELGLAGVQQLTEREQHRLSLRDRALDRRRATQDDRTKAVARPRLPFGRSGCRVLDRMSARESGAQTLPETARSFRARPLPARAPQRNSSTWSATQLRNVRGGRPVMLVYSSEMTGDVPTAARQSLMICRTHTSGT